MSATTRQLPPVNVVLFRLPDELIETAPPGSTSSSPRLLNVPWLLMRPALEINPRLVIAPDVVRNPLAVTLSVPPISQLSAKLTTLLIVAPSSTQLAVAGNALAAPQQNAS